MLNSVNLIGRLTKDPELSYTPSGIPKAVFTVAIDRPKGKDAQGEKETDFVPCTAWRQAAEFAGNYLSKGRLVCVTGRIQVRKYQTQEGQTRWSTDVQCDRVLGLDKPKDGQGVAPGGDMDTDDPFGER